MLNFFRINDPARLLALLALLSIIALPFFIYTPALTFPELDSMIVGEKVMRGFVPFTQIVDTAGPLTAYWNGLTFMVFGESLLGRHIFTLFILFIQAVVFNFILNDKKALTESTSIPSLIFVTLFLFSYDNLSLTGDLVSVFFLIFALNSLFKELEFRDQGNENVLRVGVFIGIGSLFAFSFVIYLLGVLVILVMFSRLTLSKFMLTILAFLLPHLVLLCFYYLYGDATALWQFYYLPNVGFAGESYMGLGGLLALLFIPLAFLAVALLILIRQSRFTKYQSQLLQVMFFWLVFSFLQIFYAKDLRPQSFITAIPPISFFLSHLFLIIQRKRIKEIAFWIFFSGILTVAFLTRFNRITAVNYSALSAVKSSEDSVSGKRVIVLGYNKLLYVNNRLGTPFYKWNLVEDVFREPGYYENVLTVYNGFKADPPEIIFDDQNLMSPFFERMPELKKLYRKSPLGYTKINN